MGRTRQLTLFTCQASHQNASNNASNLAKTQDFFVKICYDKPFLVGDFLYNSQSIMNITVNYEYSTTFK